MWTLHIETVVHHPYKSRKTWWSSGRDRGFVKKQTKVQIVSLGQAVQLFLHSWSKANDSYFIGFLGEWNATQSLVFCYSSTDRLWPIPYTICGQVVTQEVMCTWLAWGYVREVNNKLKIIKKIKWNFKMFWWLTEILP